MTHYLRRSISCAITAVLLNGTAGAEPSIPRVKTKQGQPASALVAAKDVCAWPNLTMLRDGTVTATIFNQPSHGSLPGEVDCWASQDQGQTWRLRGTVAPHEPNTNRMNHAAGLASDGDLIVICSGWSNRYGAGSAGAAFRATVLDPWICRSDDGGRTWAVDKTGFPARPPESDFANIPFGDIVTAGDGTLRAATYGMRNTQSGRGDQVWIYKGSDDGRTWGSPVRLHQQGSRNETALLRVDGDRWLAAARTHSLAEDGRRNHLDLFASGGLKEFQQGRPLPLLSLLVRPTLFPIGDLGRLLFKIGQQPGPLRQRPDQGPRSE